jgi:soluble lytic murein transglycosylase-like protein
MSILKKVIAVVFLAVCLFSVKSYGATVEEVKQAIRTQATAMGVDPAIMLSIAKAESGFRQEARGGGAVGVFQLMPATARNLGVNPYVLEENIKGGITYYKNLYKMFGSMELAVAAYNTGPMAVKYANYKVPYRAQGFVSRIMTDYNYYKTH